MSSRLCSPNLGSRDLSVNKLFVASFKAIDSITMMRSGDIVEISLLDIRKGNSDQILAAEILRGSNLVK